MILRNYDQIPSISQESDWLYEHRRTELEPEEKLLFALLADAIDVACSDHCECLEARRWIRDDNETWVFSFNNVCDHLGFDPETWRRLIMARAGWELAPLPPPHYVYQRKARARRLAAVA